MNVIVAVYAIIPTVFGQFNTNPFGNFQSRDSDPFNSGNSISNDPFNQQFGYQRFGYNNPSNYDNRFSNVYTNYPYNNVYRTGGSENALRCPQYWVQFQQSCYRFIKSPIRSKNDARRNCQAYESDLVGINSVEEHGFIIYQLLWRDPQRRKWYTGIVQQGPNYWINEVDGSPLANMENAFLPSNDNNYGRDAVVYRSYFFLLYDLTLDLNQFINTLIILQLLFQVGAMGIGSRTGARAASLYL